MSEATIKVSAQAGRRLVVTKQHLAGKVPAHGTKEDMLAAVRDLAYVQWDPVPVVAPSHIISLWSRIGEFRLSDLEELLWDERKLFEHWTPMASIVLTEDYPLFLSLMKRYPESLSGSWRSHEVRARKFLAKHALLRKKILRELESGPLQTSQFTDYRTKRSAPDWTPTSDVSHMLFHLLMSGDVMVVGHRGSQNVYGLSQDFLPDWVEKEELSEEEFESRAAQRAIRALGTATPREINYYFVRGRYRNLKKTLARLEEESAIRRVTVEGSPGNEERYVHEGDVLLLESLDDGAWEPRTSLIAPFDNLICGRDRTNRVFGFDYLHEQFLPKEKRKFGTFVLPILWGDSLIGRADLENDRKGGKLLVHSVHAERGAPGSEIASDVAETIQRLATFLGAKEVDYTARVPTAWKRFLR